MSRTPATSLPLLVTLCMWVAGYGLGGGEGAATWRNGQPWRGSPVNAVVVELFEELGEESPSTRAYAGSVHSSVPVAPATPARCQQQLGSTQRAWIRPPIRGPSN